MENDFLKCDIKFLENNFEEIDAIQVSWKPTKITVAAD